MSENHLSELYSAVKIQKERNKKSESDFKSKTRLK